MEIGDGEFLLYVQEECICVVACAVEGVRVRLTGSGRETEGSDVWDCSEGGNDRSKNEDRAEEGIHGLFGSKMIHLSYCFAYFQNGLDEVKRNFFEEGETCARIMTNLIYSVWVFSVSQPTFRHNSSYQRALNACEIK